MNALTTALVIGACAVAIVTDVRSRRIPNALTFGLAGVVLAISAAGGIWAFAAAAATFVVVFVLGMFAFSFGWLGGGDVKLAAAVAAGLGYHDALPFLLYTSVGGGFLAVGYAVARGRFSATIANVGGALRPMIYPGTVAAAPAPTQRLTLPYAVAIAFGATAAILSHHALPLLRLPL